MQTHFNLCLFCSAHRLINCCGKTDHEVQRRRVACLFFPAVFERVDINSYCSLCWRDFKHMHAQINTTCWSTLPLKRVDVLILRAARKIRWIEFHTLARSSGDEWRTTSTASQLPTPKSLFQTDAQLQYGHTLTHLFAQTAPNEETWCNLLNYWQESVYSLGWTHWLIPPAYWKERLQAACFIFLTLQTVSVHKSGGICTIMARFFHREPNQWKGYLACAFLHCTYNPSLTVCMMVLA